MTEQRGTGQAAERCACTEPATEPVGSTGPVGRTHVLLAVDQSGSMGPLADDVRGGFNAFLDDLAGKDNADAFRVTVLLFDTEWRTLCIAAPLAEVPRLTAENYWPSGMTALYDAVGSLIGDFERETTLGEHDRVLLVVQTDGHENSSREYNADRVKRMYGERARTGRWSAMYLGAGPDAWDGGAAMGMRSVNTHSDAATTRGTYAAVATASAGYAAGASEATTFDVVQRAVGIDDE